MLYRGEIWGWTLDIHPSRVAARHPCPLESKGNYYRTRRRASARPRVFSRLPFGCRASALRATVPDNGGRPCSAKAAGSAAALSSECLRLGRACPHSRALPLPLSSLAKSLRLRRRVRFTGVGDDCCRSLPGRSKPANRGVTGSPKAIPRRPPRHSRGVPGDAQPGNARSSRVALSGGRYRSPDARERADWFSPRAHPFRPAIDGFRSGAFSA